MKFFINRVAILISMLWLILGTIKAQTYEPLIIKMEKYNVEKIGARSIEHQVNPVYPSWAKKSAFKATVKYKITVLPNGFLKKDEVKLSQSSGYRELDRLAYDALVQWKFSVLPSDLPQVNQTGVIPFVFSNSELPTAYRTPVNRSTP